MILQIILIKGYKHPDQVKRRQLNSESFELEVGDTNICDPRKGMKTYNLVRKMRPVYKTAGEQCKKKQNKNKHQDLSLKKLRTIQVKRLYINESLKTISQSIQYMQGLEVKTKKAWGVYHTSHHFRESSLITRQL